MRDLLRGVAVLAVIGGLAIGFGLHPFKYFEAFGLFARGGAPEGQREREERVWIVVTFQREGGREAKMAFDNPSLPRMHLSECQEALQGVTPRLIDAAREREPALAGLRFIRSDCVASETAPLRPG